MYKVSYKELKYRYFKQQDSWSERFIIQIFSIPLSYIILKLNQSKKLPYIVTVLTFFVSLFGASLIYSGSSRAGAILLLCAFIMDNLDGSLSRFIYKEDPEIRSTLDFTLDNFAWLSIVLALFSIFLRNGTITEQFSFFLLVTLLTLLFTQTTTAYRLLWKFKHYVSFSAAEGQTYFYKKSKIFRPLLHLYSKNKNIAEKYRVFPYPTIPDVHFLVYIAMPLFNFQYSTLFISLGISIALLNIVERGISNYILIKEYEKINNDE